MRNCNCQMADVMFLFKRKNFFLKKGFLVNKLLVACSRLLGSGGRRERKKHASLEQANQLVQTRTILGQTPTALKSIFHLTHP